MDNPQLLLTVAEVAVALAAFSGLVSVLGRPRSPTDLRIATARLQIVLLVSLLAALFALLPFLPVQLGVPPEVAWRACSGLFASAWIVYLAWGLHRTRELRHQGIEMRSFAKGMNIVNVTLYLLAISGLVLAAVGVLTLPTEGIYLFGLYVMLLAAAGVFVQLFMSLLRPSA